MDLYTAAFGIPPALTPKVMVERAAEQLAFQLSSTHARLREVQKELESETRERKRLSATNDEQSKTIQACNAKCADLQTRFQSLLSDHNVLLQNLPFRKDRQGKQTPKKKK